MRLYMKPAPISNPPPLGKQGFNTPGSAEEDARLTITGIPFWVVSKGDDYGWVAPESYAERIVRENNLTVIWRHKK